MCDNRINAGIILLLARKGRRITHTGKSDDKRNRVRNSTQRVVSLILILNLFFIVARGLELINFFLQNWWILLFFSPGYEEKR